jgi:hypothetical protein
VLELVRGLGVAAVREQAVVSRHPWPAVTEPRLLAIPRRVTHGCQAALHHHHHRRFDRQLRCNTMTAARQMAR